MGKEIKIGLAVIGSLLLVFCGVLYWRLSKSNEPALAATSRSAKAETAAEPQPTVLHADSDPPSDSSASTSQWNQTSGSSDESQYQNAARDQDPKASYMPSADQSGGDASAGGNASGSADQPGSAPAQLSQDNPTATAVNQQNNPFVQGAPTAEAGAAQVEQQAAEAPNDEYPASNPGEVAAADDLANPLRADSSAVPDATPAAARVAVAPARTSSQLYGNGGNRPAIQGQPSGRTSAAPQNGWTTPSRTPADDYPAASEGVYAQEPQSLPAEPAHSFAGAPLAEPAAAENGRYTVQPNDNFWTISQRIYGTGGYFKALQRHNRDRFPQADQLQVGDVVIAPSKEQLAELYPDDCPKARNVPSQSGIATQVSGRRNAAGRVYVVEEGDTLFDIARYELGKASRWAEIYELNRDLMGDDFDYLQPGAQLVLPTSARQEADAITRQPGAIYQR